MRHPLSPNDATDDSRVERTITSAEDAPRSGALASDQPSAIERYVVDGEVARGGLGRILKAHDSRLDRPVAIKELLTQGAAGRERFSREASITARLEHPSIVPVHDSGTWPGGDPYYVMKLLSGGKTLKQAVLAAPDFASRLAFLPHVIAIADAMAYAHSLDIIHRDLKPSNVVIGAFGETLVIDWGLAKDLRNAHAAEQPSAGPYRAGDCELTTAGAIVGTPAYMASEQARGEPADKTSDVYALGTILYFVLSGKAPFEGDTHAHAAELVERVATEAPPALSTRQKDVPTELLAIVDQAMAIRREDRYPDAAAFADDLRRFSSGQLVRAQEYSIRMLLGRWMRRHRALLSVGAVALLILLATAGYSFRRIDRARRLAEDQRAAAVAKRNELILLQAKASLEHDPTTTLAWLKTYPLDGADWITAQTIAAEAQSLGVARYVRATGMVRDVVFLPDGKRFVVANYAKKVELWRVDGVKALASIGIDAVGIMLSPDGVHIAIGGLKGEIVLWDPVTDHARNLGQMSSPIVGLGFSDDGQQLAASGGAKIQVTDLKDGSLHRYVGRDRSVERLLFSRDGRMLFSIGSEGSLLQTTLADGSTRALTGHRGKIEDMALSTDGTLLATAGQDRTVRLWTAGMKRAQVLVAPTPVVHLSFLPGSRRLVLGSRDGVLSLWDPGVGIIRRSPALFNAIRQLIVAPDGATAAASDDRGNLDLWALATGTVTPFRGHQAAIMALAFSREGTLLSAGADLQSRLWLTRQGPRVPNAVAGVDAVPSHIVFSADGRRFATEGGKVVHVCSVATMACRDLVGHDIGVSGIAFSPDGRYLASAGWDGTARLWDLDGESSQVFKTFGPIVHKPTFTPDSQRLLATSSDGAVHVWRVVDGAPLVLNGHIGDVTALAVAPTGRALASAGDDHTVRLWDWRTGTGRVLASSVHAGSISSFSRDGTLLAEGGDDGDITLWSLAKDSRRVLSGHRDFITALLFSNDGRSLISSSWDGTARVWNLASGTSVELRGHAQRVRGAALSPDGRLVATASDDRTVRLWDLVTGAIEVLRGTGTARAVAFSPDGALLAVAGGDQTVGVWSVIAPSTPLGPTELAKWLSSQTDLTEN